MKKRILSVALCLCMMLTLIPAEAIAAEWKDIPPESDQPSTPDIGLGDSDSNPPTEESEPDGSQDTDTPRTGTNSGTCGDNLTWELSDDGTLTISGTGDMDYYYVGSGPFAPWKPYISDIKSIIIEEGVTSIGGGAFYLNDRATSVTIPSTVTSIGNFAFEGSGLKSISIPDSVTYIGIEAFASTGITEITIPSGVMVISEGLFGNCGSLKKVTLPEGITNIGDHAFSGCNSLTSIIIPDGVTSIGESTFGYCSNLTSVIIPGSVTSIGDGAFFGCSKLTSITIPKGITRIGENVFFSCTSLESVTIPDSVTSIGKSAFSSCLELKSVVIPNNVVCIEENAFSHCGRLINITIPNSVTSIESYAFFSCSNLPSITIPDSVSSIGDGVFGLCHQLAEIIVSPNNETYVISDDMLFTKDMSTVLWCPIGKIGAISLPETTTNIDTRAFQGCKSLTSITMPDGVVSIGERAFVECSGLTSIIIPNSVTSIGGGAFSGCKGLTSITIPNSVTSIEDSAFFGCSGLTSIIVPNSVISIGRNAFEGTSSDFILCCYPDSYAESYAKSNNIKYELLTPSGRTLSVAVWDEEGAAVNSGFAMIWYDEDGNGIGTSNPLVGADNEKTYFFVITLGDDLSALYEQPTRGTIAPSDPAKCDVRLVKKAEVKTLTLSGRVADPDGAAIPGAAVTITSAGGDSVEVATGPDGGFSADVPYGIVSIIIRMDGYYSKRETLDLADEAGDTYNAGTYTLAPIQVITDRVTLSVTQVRATEEADGAIDLPLSSLGAMEVSVSGKDSADFEVQGLTVLFKPGVVQADEEITVTITDPTGAYRAASGTVELDGNRLGSVELTMMQKGSLVLGGLSGLSANLLLFDSNGNCILTNAATPGLSSGTLEAGTYRAVLIQKSELLRGVSALSYLDTFGLREGQDYLLREVSITDGRITRLADCTVPALDESRISYTIAENTGVSTSKPSGVSAGEMLMVRAAYELDKAKGVTAESLQIVLPEGVSLTGTSATIDGKTVPYTYDAAKREVKISTTGRGKAVVWLCCTPETSGSHSISAYLTLSSGAAQPIGAAVFQAENAKLNVPERTGKAEGLTASGKTMPGCAVTLYDNDVEVRTVTANAAGSWSMEFDLTQPVYSYSYHNIYAVISGGTLAKPIQTEGILVTYDKRLDVELTKITMYNTDDSHRQKTTVFDFTSSGSTATPYYRIYPSRYPTFTFKAEFSGDASHLSDVYVVTTNSAGDKTYVKMQYDAASGAWVGTHNYTTFSSAPVAVTAAYSLGDLGEIPFDEEMAADIQQSYTEANEKVMDFLETAFSEAIHITNVTESENSICATANYTNPDTKITQSLGTFLTEVSPLEKSITAEMLDEDGYELIHDERQIWVKQEEIGAKQIQIYVDLYNHIRIGVTVQMDQPGAEDEIILLSSPNRGGNPAIEITMYGLLLVMGVSAGAVIGGILAIYGVAAGISWLTYGLSMELGLVLGPLVVNAFNGHFSASGFEKKAKINQRYYLDSLNNSIDECARLLEARCSEDGHRKLSIVDYNTCINRLEVIKVMTASYGDESTKLISDARTAIFAKALSLGTLGGISTTITSPLDGLDMALEVYDGDIKTWTTRKIYDQYKSILMVIDKLKQDIKSAYQPCNGEDDDLDSLPGMTLQPSSRPMQAIHDPSGYVYEAVPSNRLEGVTATIFSQAGGKWNAAAYDQTNPQVTGADGGYYWDVPQGNWRVSFTKAGYENADTSQVEAAVNGWLPVPPPQLEVNVGMVSTAAPTVKQAAVYTDRVEVKFSQYMDIASVQGTLSLMQNSAALSGCTIEALDAEYNLENTVQYATRFAITPSDAGILSDGLVVSVSTGAKNYAGEALVLAYTSETLRASVRPTGIEVADTVSVGLHKEVGLSLTLQPSAAARELVIENLSPNLIGTTGTVTTSADGTATVSIAGILPGSGIIRIIEPVSGLSTTVSVNVSFGGAGEEVSVLPVEAILNDGRTVTDGMPIPRNTEITLQTNTPGAVIRYTLNDTCPCTQEALTYSEPITIDSSTVLRAAAYKNGVYSTTIRLHLNVETSGETHAHSWEAAWSIDANGHWHVCTCGAKSDFATHAEDGGKVTTAATAYQDGERTYSCTVCEYVIRTERIPAIGGGAHGGGSSSGGGGSGSSSGSTYSVSVSSRILNGTVRISPSNAQKGDTVTIMVIPNTGYKLDKLTVTDSKGNKVTAREQSNGKLTFTMPADKVTVDATFVKIDGTSTRPTGPSISFTDVISSAYYADAVVWAVEKGITVGTSATTFSPDAPCTRAQIVTFLWRAAGSPAMDGSNPFTDVAPGSYYYDAVQWAVAQGVTVGTSATTFSPDATCTRSQAVTFLYRYEKSPAVSGSNAFTDVLSDAYYADAVQWAVNNGVTAGTSATTFSPNATCTRSQIVTFLYRDMA